MTDTEDLTSDDIRASILRRHEEAHAQRQRKERTERRFLFVARISTDQERGMQDERVSVGWQLDEAEKVVAGNGVIVEKVWDRIPRSKPWPQRPNAWDALQRIESGELEVDALVVGETKRMFVGSQLEIVYDLLSRHGVELWLPDLNRYDPDNLTHRLSLGFEGILGKNESDTIRRRVRASMDRIGRSSDPRWLGGNAPLGYKLVQLEASRVMSTNSKGFTNTLAVDETTKPIVQFIFGEFIAGKSFRQIAKTLEEQGIKNRTGGDRWSTSTLSNILKNATYIGLREYGKQRKFQEPVRPGDSRYGEKTSRTRKSADYPMVLSETTVYPPIISNADFQKAQNILASKYTATKGQEKHRTPKDVVPLQGLVYCRRHKMQVDRITKSGRLRFRSRGDRVAGAPISTVSDAALEATVHGWLTDAFSRRNLPKVLKRLNERAPSVLNAVERLEAEKRDAERAARNLLRMIERLPESGAGSEQAYDLYRTRQGEVAVLEARIADLRATEVNVDEAERLLVALSRDMERVLSTASRKKLRELYEALTLRLDYNPDERTVRISVSPVFTGETGVVNSQCPWRGTDHSPHRTDFAWMEATVPLKEVS